MLAIKINIVLEIIINSWQKRGHWWPQDSFIILPIKVTFHFKISWLATLKFKKVLKENKERKYLRSSGEMKRQAEACEILKLRDYLLIKFKKLSTFKMLWLVYELFSLCSGQLWAVFTVNYPDDFYGKGQSKYFLRNLETSATISYKVFARNSALRENFNFYFSKVLCKG